MKIIRNELPEFARKMQYRTADGKKYTPPENEWPNERELLRDLIYAFMSVDGNSIESAFVYLTSRKGVLVSAVIIPCEAELWTSEDGWSFSLVPAAV